MPYASRETPCKGSALPTELIARTGFTMVQALGGAPYADAGNGTQGRLADLVGAASPVLFPNSVPAMFRPHPPRRAMQAIQET